MNVRNQRNIILLLNKRIFYFKACIGFFLALHRYADNVSSSISYFHYLQVCSRNILRICGGHSLDSYRMFATNGHISNHHGAGFSPHSFVYIFTIFLPRY
nr:hypothetical protein Iba_chr07eCG4250 [Ipomoea batatas]